MSIYAIGDVHGKIWDYQKRLKEEVGPHDWSIQVGDMGVGFADVKLPPMQRHKFFRGNHDSPEKCWRHANYIGDYGYVDQFGINSTDPRVWKPNGFGNILTTSKVFWVAGASSIDRQHRTEGVSWWSNEELNYVQANRTIDLYKAVKPNIVLSHDCPQSVFCNMFCYPYTEPASSTRRLLQALLEIHQPSLWIFGHHHASRRKTIDSVEFICLGELESFHIPNTF